MSTFSGVCRSGEPMKSELFEEPLLLFTVTASSEKSIRTEELTFGTGLGLEIFVLCVLLLALRVGGLCLAGGGDDCCCR